MITQPKPCGCWDDRECETHAEISSLRAQLAAEREKLSTLRNAIRHAISDGDVAPRAERCLRIAVTATEDCNAYGADDVEVQADPLSPDPYCDCGATAKRNEARAAIAKLKGGPR